MTSKRKKLKAAILGYAIGDTLGKGTELMETFEVRMRYPQGLRRYDQIYQDSHRSQWGVGEWTNDTEFVLMLGEVGARDCGNLNFDSQAKGLVRWYVNGPLDISPNIRMVVSQTDFLEHPFETSRRSWSQRPLREPSNEILGRALFVSFFNGDPVENARKLTLMTHCDPACEACAALLGLIGPSLMEKGKLPEIAEMKKLADSIDPSVAPVMRHAFANRPDDLQAEDPDFSWEVRRSLAIVLWAFTQHATQEEALYALIDRGGDADTTAALLMALLALRDGELRIPDHLISGLVGRKRVEENVDRWADAAGWE